MNAHFRIYTSACLVYAIGLCLLQPGNAGIFTAKSLAAKFDDINGELKEMSSSLIELVNKVDPITDKFFYGASIVARFHRENPTQFDGEGLRYISDTIEQTKKIFPEVEFAVSTLYLALQYSTDMQQALSKCIQGFESIGRPEQLTDTPKFIADFYDEYEKFKRSYNVAKSSVKLIDGKNKEIAHITEKLLSWSRFLCESHRNKLEEAKARLRAGFDDLYKDLGLTPPIRNGTIDPTCQLTTITKEFDTSLAPQSPESEKSIEKEGESGEQSGENVSLNESETDNDKTGKSQMGIPTFVMSSGLLLFYVAISQM